MKKFYSLMLTMALVALSASAQVPGLKPFRSHPSDSEINERVFLSKSVSNTFGLKKAPRYATATGKRALSYCDGTYDNALGLPSMNYGDSVAGAIAFSKTQLAPYVGKKIVAINIPVIEPAVLVSVHGWIATGSINKLTTIQKVENPVAGYNELILDEPIEIDGESDIYIGASYKIQSGTSGDDLYCIPFNTSVDVSSGAGYLGYGKSTATRLSWMDYSTYGYGAFAVEGVVDGVEMNATDLTVKDFVLEKEYASLNDVMRFEVDVKNNGANDISSFDVEVYVNGTKTSTHTVKPEAAIATDKVYSTVLSERLALETSARDVTFGIKVVNINGQGDDDNMDDNVAEETFNACTRVFHQSVLVEEGTGQWCGYCPQGIVALDAMKEKGYEDFVAVAIHYGYLGNRNSVSVDSMAFAVDDNGYEYCNILGIKSFPTALYNRQYEASAYYAENYYNALKEFAAPGYIYARAYWDGDNVVVFGDALFGLDDEDGSKYRIQTYLIEDSVGPYYQHNYYAGGGQGNMGGFEDLTEWTPIVYNDVLRGVYPSVTYGGTLGEQLTDGAISATEDYSFSYTYEITDEVNHVKVVNNKGYFESGARYADKTKLRLAVLLIDSNNDNAVVNCCNVPIAENEEASVVGVKAQDNASVEYYSINGTRLAGPAAKGIYIMKQGSKVTKRIAR